MRRYYFLILLLALPVFVLAQNSSVMKDSLEAAPLELSTDSLSSRQAGSPDSLQKAKSTEKKSPYSTGLILCNRGYTATGKIEGGAFRFGFSIPPYDTLKIPLPSGEYNLTFKADDYYTFKKGIFFRRQCLPIHRCNPGRTEQKKGSIDVYDFSWCRSNLCATPI